MDSAILNGGGTGGALSIPCIDVVCSFSFISLGAKEELH